MSTVTIPYRFVVKRDTAANFTAANTLLLSGEWGLETDTRKMKMGDGATAWNSLAYREDVAAAIHAATSKTTPVDADEMALVDSAASNVLKKLTWLNLKATLKTYFDTLYAGVAGSPVSLIGTVTVAGSAATTMTLSGLDLSAYKSFFVLFSLKNATGSASSISLYYNADTTAGNYSAQGMTVANTTSTPSRVASGIVESLPASETSTGNIRISNDQDGRPRAFLISNRDSAASITFRYAAHRWATASNVTSITLSSSVASAFAVGSTFSVYGNA